MKYSDPKLGARVHVPRTHYPKLQRCWVQCGFRFQSFGSGGARLGPIFVPKKRKRTRQGSPTLLRKALRVPQGSQAISGGLGRRVYAKGFIKFRAGLGGSHKGTASRLLRQDAHYKARLSSYIFICVHTYIQRDRDGDGRERKGINTEKAQRLAAPAAPSLQKTKRRAGSILPSLKPQARGKKTTGNTQCSLRYL